MTDADRIDQYRVAADLCEEGGFGAAAAVLRKTADMVEEHGRFWRMTRAGAAKSWDVAYPIMESTPGDQPPPTSIEG